LGAGAFSGEQPVLVLVLVLVIVLVLVVVLVLPTAAVVHAVPIQRNF
jgi:hypothetical protein